MTCPTVALHTRMHAGWQWTLGVLSSKCRIPIMVRVVGGTQDLTDSPGRNKPGIGARNSPVGGSAAKADRCHTPGLSHGNTTIAVPAGPLGWLRMPVLPRCDSFPPADFTGALNSDRAWATSGELGNVAFRLSGACALATVVQFTEDPLVFTLNLGRPVKKPPFQHRPQKEPPRQHRSLRISIPRRCVFLKNTCSSDSSHPRRVLKCRELCS